MAQSIEPIELSQTARERYLRYAMSVITSRAIGHARGNSPEDPEDTPLVKATPDTLYNFFSGSKTVTAMLIHLLQQEEQLPHLQLHAPPMQI